MPWFVRVRHVGALLIVAFVFLCGSLRAQVAPEPASLQPSPLGRLETIGVGLPRQGQWRNSFAVADMNLDKIPDLVHGTGAKVGRPSGHLSGGWPGRFRPLNKASFPQLPYDYGVVTVADFDGDGLAVDIALSAHLRGITVLIGDGQGNFTEWEHGLTLRRPVGTGAMPFCAGALAAVDWNQDGRMDLVAIPEGASRVALRAGRRQSDGGVLVFLNEPEAWRPILIDSASPSLIGTSLAIGDVNADGRQDVLTGSATLGLSRLLHLNAGGARSEQDPALPVPGRAFVTTVGMADFDKNGRSDPIVGFSVLNGTTWEHRVEVHLSFPGRFQTVSLTKDPEKSAFRAIAAGDLDGDGKLDLAAVLSDGSLKLYRGGPEDFTLALVELAPAWRRGCAGYDVQIVDLDRDGGPEIVASFAGEPSGYSFEATTSSGGGIQAWRLSNDGAAATFQSR